MSITRLIRHPLSRQIFAFGSIGILAAVVNFAVLIFIVECFHWHPWPANILAFMLAFQVSFFGHHHWTFRGVSTAKKRHIWVRFLIVATFSMLMNQGLYAIYLYLIPWYGLALFFTLATVPPITFVLAKLWAFR
jgi:putative flippase GtrA